MLRLDHRVVLQVSERRVAVAEQLLEVREQRPNRFTVVRRAVGEPNPADGTPEDLGRTYAVCPACDDRVRLLGEMPVARCRRCGHRGEIAWWETG